MSRIQEARWTNRPIDAVFAYVSDFTTTAEYDPGVSSAVRIDDGPLGAGSEFSVDAVFMGRILPMRYRITHFDPPHRMDLRGEASTSTAEDCIVFVPKRGGTEITWTLDLQLTGISRLGQPFMGPIFRRLGRKALDGLAARLADPRTLR
jgi:carbon monoxide dehydrogenase subunit G